MCGAFLVDDHNVEYVQVRLEITMSTLRPEIIAAAVEGFESRKVRLDEQISELRGMLGGASPESTAAPHNGGRRQISAAAQRRMAAGQRRRWAVAKAESAPAPAASKGKRRLSAAGRAAIVAALKKRWAAKKAAGKRPQPVVLKKAVP